MRRSNRAIAILGGAVLVGVTAGCGRKGPPLPPLRPTPGAVTAVSARRVGSHIDLRFTIPTTNTDRTSPAAVARVEIYARSVPANSPRPIKEQIVLKENLVRTIDVKPPAKTDDTPEDAAAAPTKPADDRPGTGDSVTFSEDIPAAAPVALPELKGKAAQAAAAAARANAAAATPPAAPGATPPAGQPPTGAATTTPPASGAATTTAGAVAGAAQGAAGAATAPAASAAAKPPAAPPPAPPIRYFWIQAIAPHGQVGPPPDLVAVPLTDPPPAPTGANIDFDEKTMTFTWKPGAEDETFRVYQVDANGKEKGRDGRPLNDAPLKTASYQAPVVFDQEICLAVRAVEMRGTASVESDAVASCKTPRDIFPPPAPTNLNGLPDNGAIGLRWDPVTAADLAGYLVLRGEGTGDTLQQLTPAPLTATTYVDSTVRSGVTYVYVVVAVDKATPPNRSEHSNTYSVTIR